MSTAELKQRKSKRLQSKGAQGTNTRQHAVKASKPTSNGRHDKTAPRPASKLWFCSLAVAFLAASILGIKHLGSQKLQPVPDLSASLPSEYRS